MLQLVTWLADKIDPRRLLNRKRSLEHEPAPGDRMTILVARLEDDDARDSHQSHILRSLERRFESLGVGRAVDVIEYGRILKLDDVVGTRADAYLAAVEEGRRWLQDTNADILIWGAVADQGRVLSLRFLARAHEAAAESQGFGLNEVTELPAEFSEALSNVLTAEVIASAASALSQSGWYVSHLLKPMIKRLRPLAANPPPGLSPNSRGAVSATLAHALTIYGEQAGDNDALQAAVTAYRAALEEFTALKATAYLEGTERNLERAQAVLRRLRGEGED